MSRVRVLFVCSGNICRSPTAEGILRALAAQEGLAHAVEVESAGTGDWHVGEPADPRTRATALARGIALEGRARQVRAADFDRFDYVLAMDRGHLLELERLSGGRARRAVVARFLDFHPEHGGDGDVSDPYYGGEHGFDDVFELCHAACRSLLRHLREHHDLVPKREE